MKYSIAFVMVVFCSGEALAQFFLPEPSETEDQQARTIDKNLWNMQQNLQSAKLGLICSQVWDGKYFLGEYPVGETLFLDIAYDRISQFVASARREGFELPDYSEMLSPFLLTAIDAPNADIGVGSIYAKLSFKSDEIVRKHEEAIDSVEVDEQFKDVTRALEAGRIYRCEDLIQLNEAAE